MDLLSYLLGKEKSGGTEPIDTTDLRTVINLTGASLTSETPISAYSDELYDGYLNIIDNTSSFTNEIIGTNTTGIIEDGYNYPVREMKLSKLSTQSETPTSSNPVEVSNIDSSVSITISDGTNSDTDSISLGANKLYGLGTNKNDEIVINKVGNCSITKKIGEYILNGGETGWMLSSSDTNTTFFYLPLSYISSDIMSDYFIRNDNLYYEDVECIKGNTSNNRLFLRISNSIATTTTQLKAWLSTHNVHIYYVLQTPQEIDLNTNVDLTLYNGDNTITNSKSMDMNITYVKNYK